MIYKTRMTVVQITLPDALAREATNAGLLTPAALEKLLREELRSSRLERLAASRGNLLDESLAMTPDEVAAEIQAYRAKASRATGT